MHQAKKYASTFWLKIAAQKWPRNNFKAREVFGSVRYENLVVTRDSMYDGNKLVFNPFSSNQ